MGQIGNEYLFYNYQKNNLGVIEATEDGLLWWPLLFGIMIKKNIAKKF